MTKNELKEKMLEIVQYDTNGNYFGDNESDHYRMDQLLLEFINDKEVTKIYNSFDKWYA